MEGLCHVPPEIPWPQDKGIGLHFRCIPGLQGYTVDCSPHSWGPLSKVNKAIPKASVVVIQSLETSQLSLPKSLVRLKEGSLGIGGKADWLVL